jgi:hypothetical protein
LAESAAKRVAAMSRLRHLSRALIREARYNYIPYLFV